MADDFAPFRDGAVILGTTDLPDPVTVCDQTASFIQLTSSVTDSLDITKTNHTSKTVCSAVIQKLVTWSDSSRNWKAAF